MYDLSLSMTIFAVTGVTIWPYWCVSSFIRGEIVGGAIIGFLTIITFPFWFTILRRSRRHLITRLEPSLGFSPGDRILLTQHKPLRIPSDEKIVGRATLVERMAGLPILDWDSDGSACPESWWAIEDSTGHRVRALHWDMEHLPVLDRLAEIK